MPQAVHTGGNLSSGHFYFSAYYTEHGALIVPSSCGPHPAWRKSPVNPRLLPSRTPMHVPENHGCRPGLTRPPPSVAPGGAVSRCVSDLAGTPARTRCELRSAAAVADPVGSNRFARTHGGRSGEEGRETCAGHTHPPLPSSRQRVEMM